MLCIITILLVSGVAFVLVTIARRRLSIPRRKSIAMLATFMTAVGAILAVIACGRIDESRIIRSWPTTQATVIDSHITQDRVHNPDVRYTYNVDGVLYEGETKFGAPGFGGKRKRYDVALEITEENPVGSHLTVHYDPGNPSTSTPMTNVSWATYTKLSFGLLLLASGIFVGLAMMLGGIRRDRSQSPS